MRRLALLAFAVLSAACSDATAPVAPTPYSGTYRLATVNGAPLPLVVFTSGAADELRVEVVSETLDLRPDGTCRTVAVHRLHDGARVEQGGFDFACTYTVDERGDGTAMINVVVPALSGAGMVLTWDDGAATLESADGPMVYRR